MSVYQQPQSYYGAQSYPAPAFAAPSVYGSYYHQQPPVAPVYFMDPHSFRREYSARLADLTVNSRPIIQNLSMLAHEYSRYAEIVSECLQLHIQRVPPWMKLPAFYLLDMISKNIFDPYARHFASFVIPLFLDAYHAVDLPTRSKMEELLLTWRSGAPNRKELFGVAAQVAIERGVWGDGGSSSASASRGPTKTQVLSELEFALGQKERAVQSNPYDAASQQHVAVLQQLRRVVEAGVSQPELQQILNQLRTLVQPASPQAPPPQAPSWTAPPASFPSSSRSVYPPPEPVPMQAPTPNSVLAPSTSTPVPSAAPDFSALLSTLMKAGVVASKNGTPVDNSAHDTRDNIETESADVSLEHDAARAYMESILLHDVQLSTAGITRSTPAIAELLYAADSLQCRQCGLRYPNTPIGKKSRQEHLDMHFRQNRKVNENLGRGHSRSWFVAVEDWVNDTMDVKGKGRAGVRRLSATAVAAAERSKRDAELRALFVTVPPGDEAKLIACPICKETLKSEFIEDDEDWVWKNAVIKDGRVYHATCHAETSSNSLASRLLGQPRSRSGTPERFVKEGTPPSSGLKRQSPTPSPNSRVAGIKRKVEDTLSGSPPVKKFAIAAS